MKTIAVCALAFASVASYAQVTAIGPFTPAPPFRENFDSIFTGSYSSLSVFGSPAVATQIGTGNGMIVAPFTGNPSAPNIFYGDGVDIAISSGIPMRRFGGYFRSGVIGLFSSSARFDFYDASNTFIGSQTVPLTTSWAWIGFQTTPKWRRVEIYGAIPGYAGIVAMDSLVIKPN